MKVDICHLSATKGFHVAERQTELLIKALAAYNIPQRLITRKGSALAEQCQGVANLRIYQAYEPVTAFLACRSSSVIHAHDLLSSFIALLSKWIWRVPYILTRRSAEAPKSNKVMRTLYGNASDIIVLTKGALEAMNKYDHRLSVTRIPNAVARYKSDPGQVQRMRERWGAEFVIGQISTIDFEYKGQDLTLDLARRWSKDIPNVHFVFIGTGKDEETLRMQAAAVPNAHVVGQVANVGDYLAALDLVVMPWRKEGLGNVLMDALALGIPVVASQVGGITDVVAHGRTGVLVPPEDVNTLDKVLRALYQNNAQRQTLGQNAQKIAAAYSPEQITARYIDVYQSIVDLHAHIENTKA